MTDPPKPRLAPCRRTGNHVLLSLLALPSAFLIGQSALLDQPTLPPGRLVDLGGYRLHLYCTGPTSPDRPTVVLSAGAGDLAIDWTLVQPTVAQSARVCSYDRAGSGWSDPGPEPRSLHQEAGELRRLLTSAGERPPYIVVGHSLGGLVVRVFQAENPGETVGMVLVDPAHEDQRLGYRGQFVKVRTIATGRAVPAFRTFNQSPPVLLTGADLNRCRTSPSTATIYGPFVKLPEAAQRLRLWVQSHPSCVAEGDDYLPEELAAMFSNRRLNPQPLGNVPLVVIFGARVEEPPGVPLEEWRRERSDQMADLSRLSLRGRVVTDERSGHHVHLDDPPIVIEAIRETLQQSLTQ